jgi:CheY-like chemotaxis protein
MLHLLQRLGHSVEIASTGPVALAKLCEQAFDAALVDVQLPGMSGLEVAMRLRAYERTYGGHVPMIAITAYAFPEDKARCLEAGMDAYLSKPIEAAVLYAALRETVGEAPQRQQPSLNIPRILQSVGGDRTLLHELGRLFLLHVPQQLAALQEALSHDDAAAIGRAAHVLRGSMATFHADEACRLLEMLLTMRHAEQLHSAVTLPILQALQGEINYLLTLVRTPGWDG